MLKFISQNTCAATTLTSPPPEENHLQLIDIPRGIIKLILALCVLAFGLIAGVFAGALPPPVFAKLTLWWNALAVASLGVRVRVINKSGENFPPARGTLLLCNHISWLDPLVLGALWPVTFLAHSGITKWPVLGWLFRKAGVLFIARGRGAKRAVADIGAALRARRRVALFPEGRTSDGRGVAKFHPRLLQAAIDTAAPVQPLALRYLGAAGEIVTRHSFADRTFARSVWACASGPRIIAEVTVFAPLPASRKRETPARRAEELARAVVEG